MSESPTTDRVETRKLRVHALFRMPELVGRVPGLGGTTVDTRLTRVERHPPVQVHSVYYDTQDLRLIRWGVTLRRRSGGPEEGWHLTLPVDGAEPGIGDEMHLPLDTGEPGHVPETMADVVTALARRQPLLPVATLHTQRTSYLLCGDDDVVTALARRQPLLPVATLHTQRTSWQTF